MGLCNSSNSNKNSYINESKKDKQKPYDSSKSSYQLKSNKTIINSNVSNTNVNKNVTMYQNNKNIIYPKGKALLFSRVEE